jgi:AcrR family transcriptional regulator
MPQISDKRERLLQAGRNLIHRRGYRQTTLADIAAESGVPLGNVYYYFQTKQDLLTAVAGRLTDDFLSRMKSIEEKHSDPRKRIVAFLDSVVANRSTLAEQGCPVGSLCQELGKAAAPGREPVNRALIVRAEWAAQQFRLMGRTDAQDLGLALIGAVQGIILMANAAHDPELIARQVPHVGHWLTQF